MLSTKPGAGSTWYIPLRDVTGDSVHREQPPKLDPLVQDVTSQRKRLSLTETLVYLAKCVISGNHAGRLLAVRNLSSKLPGAFTGVATMQKLFCISLPLLVLWHYCPLATSGRTWSLGEAPSKRAGQNILPLAFDPLPLGSIKANGWLLDELTTEANGLAGHEHDFYLWVADSSWLGGSSEYSSLNEGFPYWFNALVPLAYSLDDARLKDQVHSAAQTVLDRQQSDGWIGPETGASRIFWGRFPAFLGFMNLVEANSTWEEPVIGALTKFNGLANSMLADNYTGYIYHGGDEPAAGNYEWGRVRYADMIISLLWMLEKYPGDQEQILLDNINFFLNGSFNWKDWYTEATYPTEDLTYSDISDTGYPPFPYVHGVNVGQGFKAPAVERRLTNNDSLVQTAMDAVNWTFTYHGAASGAVLADERLAGLHPWSGSELCQAVETMYSLTYLYQALGNSYYADRAEITAFNAMPALLTADWWGHQYMGEPNQPWATNLSTSPFWNVNTVGQTFGLEPNYPCCAVNHPQGLPKFLMATYATTGDGNGLVHSQLSPAVAQAELSNGSVTVNCTTNYPFSGLLTYEIDADNAFDLYVRVPSWYLPSNSSVELNSDGAGPLSPDPTTGLHRITMPAGTSTVTYNLGAQIRTEARANDTIAVYYGALLYSLEVNFTSSSSPPHNYSDINALYPNAPSQSRDWYYTNSSAWNYAIDPSTMVFRSSPSGSPEPPLPSPIFAPGAPPVWIEAKGCLIGWSLFLGSVPGAPPVGSDRSCLSDVETVRLVPYGSAKLHMAELPTISLAS